MGRLRALVAMLIAAVLTLSACGDGTTVAQAFDDPEEAVLAAFGALDLTTTEATFGFDGTPAELFEALVALDDTFPADEPGTDALVDLLANASVTATSNGEDGAMTVTVGGTPLAELRMIDQIGYGRLDVDSLIEVVGRMQPEAAEELEFTLRLVPFIAVEDPSLTFVGDLFQGRWVSLPIPDDTDPNAPADDDQSLDEELTAIIEEILAENSEITHTGSARGGERFVVQVDVARTMAALADNPRAARTFDLGDVSTDPSEIVAEMQRDGMASTTEFDVVIANGVVTSMRFDLAALSVDVPDGVTMPVLVTFADSPAALSAPADHTPIPLDALDAWNDDLSSPLRPID